MDAETYNAIVQESAANGMRRKIEILKQVNRQLREENDQLRKTVAVLLKNPPESPE